MSYMNAMQYRPEIALRRSREMQHIGKPHEGCQILHETLTSKRMGRFWNQNHEDMMIEFINLCTELRETRWTKDGLYFYRQLTQVQNAASLEKIVHYMVDSAQKKCMEVRAAMDATTAMGVLDRVEDLEEEDESLQMLMSAVVTDDRRERAEREQLMPWVRHLWHTFRNVLENIRYVPRLESLYHLIAVKAMHFCREYKRSKEFKTLCHDMMQHLSVQQRRQAENNTVMSVEQLERHLTTRFVQLEVAAELNLWSEGFRIVEHISSIITSATTAPKAQLMATYYEKLARVFWVADEHLSHAYAWHKFFTLSVAQNKMLSEEDRRNMASAAVLAALAIPLQTDNSATAVVAGAPSTAVEFEVNRPKRTMLANLLKLPTLPSRDMLLSDLVAKGVLRMVRPEIAELYRLLEVEFTPLTLVSRVAPILAKLRAQTGATVTSSGTLTSGTSAASLHSLSQYAPSLEKLAIFRTLQQLCNVYSTMSLTAFRGITTGLTLNHNDVERLIARAVRNGMLPIRLDHRAGSLYLGRDAMESTAMRRQLTELAVRLTVVVNAVKRLRGAQVVPDQAAVRLSAAFDAARTFTSVHDEYVKRQTILSEKESAKIIQQVKEEASTAVEERAAPAAPVMSESAMAVAHREAEEKRKLKMENMRVLLKTFEEPESNWTEAQLEKMTEDELQKLLSSKKSKQRSEEKRRRREQSKRLDIIIRAIREVEQQRVTSTAPALFEADAAYVAQRTAEEEAKERAKFEARLKYQPDLLRIKPYMSEFEASVIARRRAATEKELVSRRDADFDALVSKKLEAARKRKLEADKENARREEARKAEAAAEAAAAAAASRSSAYVPPSMRRTGDAAGGASGAFGSSRPTGGSWGAPSSSSGTGYRPSGAYSSGGGSSGGYGGGGAGGYRDAAPAPAPASGSGSTWMARRAATSKGQ